MKLAGEKRVRIVMSIWAVNEAIAAIDRKHRRKEISDSERGQIFATILRRTIDHAEKPNAPIHFIPIDRKILSLSTDVITQYRASADDALHLCTAYATDCECFLYHDEKLKHLIGENMSGVRLLDITRHADTNPLLKSFDKE